ncbi:MAG: helix-turn-helix transcriptional regulator [Thermoanaerobaculia bacterium]
MRLETVTLGESLQAGDFGWFTITEAIHRPHLVLKPHCHRYPAITIVRGGSFRLHMGRSRFECNSTGVFFKHGDQWHVNEFGSQGARSLIVELRTDRTRALDGGLRLPRQSFLDCRPRSVRLAAEIEHEFAALDWAAAVNSLEALTLELLASMRRSSTFAAPREPPQWLRTAHGLIHARFNRSLRMVRLAREAKVHPIHLARVFRRFYGCTVGEYIRRLRVNYAASELRNTEASLAAIALAAGFYDQSHFSRWFKRQMGVTPGRYRAAVCSRCENQVRAGVPTFEKSQVVGVCSVQDY